MKRKLLMGAVVMTTLLSITACAENKEVKQEQVNEEKKVINYTYGTANLTYAEYYSGDVSSVDSIDAVSSATKAKYAIMPNMDTDFVDENNNANGYHIVGVKNVVVAVNTDDVETYKQLNPTFVETGKDAPTQYKEVKIEDNKATYSKMVMNIVDTVKDANAELLTGTNWGDYQINVTDGEKKYIRNTREDEGFTINSEIQGIILETKTGLKVGMEHLQSIWVQPYEVSFNVLSDNTHNTHIAGYDNLTELSKLVGETVTKITYIMPTETYVYEFDGIYIKPAYEEKIAGNILEDNFKLSTNDFSKLENAKLDVNYTVGSGREAKKYSLFSGKISDAEYKLNLAEIETLEDKSGVYSAIISSENYADIIVSIPASLEQIEALEILINTAEEQLALDPSNKTLKEHIQEAKDLLNEEATAAAIASISNELTQLTSAQSSNTEHGGNK